jgi:hypothetical protein
MNVESGAPNESLPAIELAGAITLEAWRKAAGLSRTSAFLWRRSGKLKVTYRYGHAYVTAEENRRILSEVGSKVRSAQRR